MPAHRTRTVALLGCGGFIGSHLLERILSTTDWQVEGIDRISLKINHLLDHSRFHFTRMDLRDASWARPLIERCGTVISLAALCNPYLYTRTPVSVIESNFVDMYPLVRLCSETACRLIHFSTSEVYGRTVGSLCTEKSRITAHDPVEFNETETPLLLGPVHAQRWCYASAKQLLERAIFAYGFEHDLDYTIIRPFNFIGPRMDFIPGVDGEGVPRVLACFMHALLTGSPLQLVDGGKNRRCFTDIRDAIDAIMLVLERPDASRQKIFNIGNPFNEISIAQLATRMIELFRESGPVPGTAARFIVESVDARTVYGEGYEDSDRRIPDITAIGGALGWHPSIGLDDALRAAIEGFISEYGRHFSQTVVAEGRVGRETL